MSQFFFFFSIKSGSALSRKEDVNIWNLEKFFHKQIRVEAWAPKILIKNLIFSNMKDVLSTKERSRIPSTKYVLSI